MFWFSLVMPLAISHVHQLHLSTNHFLVFISSLTLTANVIVHTFEKYDYCNNLWIISWNMSLNLQLLIYMRNISMNSMAQFQEYPRIFECSLKKTIYFDIMKCFVPFRHALLETNRPLTQMHYYWMCPCNILMHTKNTSCYRIVFISYSTQMIYKAYYVFKNHFSFKFMVKHMDD